MLNYTLDELSDKNTLEKASEEFVQLTIKDDSGSTNSGHFDLDTYIINDTIDETKIDTDEMKLIISI